MYREKQASILWWYDGYKSFNQIFSTFMRCDSLVVYRTNEIINENPRLVIFNDARQIGSDLEITAKLKGKNT